MPVTKLKTSRATPDIPRLLYNVDDSAYLLSISRSKLWALIADGRIGTVKLDKRTLINVSELHRFAGSLPLGEPCRIRDSDLIGTVPAEVKSGKVIPFTRSNATQQGGSSTK